METLKIGRREYRIVKREGDFVTVEADIKSKGEVVGKATFEIPATPESAAKHFVAKNYFVATIYGLDLQARSSDRPRAEAQDAVIKINGVDTDLLKLPVAKTVKIINGVMAASEAGVRVPGLEHYKFASSELVKAGKVALKDGALVVKA